jgi:hypothetical protein
LEEVQHDLLRRWTDDVTGFFVNRGVLAIGQNWLFELHLGGVQDIKNVAEVSIMIVLFFFG